MSGLLQKNMRLFGVPYQFNEKADIRYDQVSTTIGKTYAENILMEAPIVTFIPGRPKYLAGMNRTEKLNTTTALISAADSNSFSSLQSIINGDDDPNHLRLYDFQRSYTEYMKYVNVMCRAGASFLGLANDSSMLLDGSTSYQQYDWRNYRSDGEKYSNLFTKTGDTLTKNIKGAIDKLTMKYETTDSDNDETESVQDMLTDRNYVQFYIDPESTVSDSFSNSVGDSQMKSLFDQGSSTLKEISFMANSGGVDTNSIQEFLGATADSFNQAASTILGGGGNDSLMGQAGNALSRIINLGSNVIKGENVIIPQIYQSSSHQSQYTITIHLKTPYGTPLGYYLDIFVPMMHLIALCAPKQGTANTYREPFLVKTYVEGAYTCNLGMIESLSIQRTAESNSVNGLPNEVDVSIQLVDLYSDFSISPQSDPILFVNNSSLVEYLATNCGMSLIQPNVKKKLDLLLNTTQNAITNIPANVGGAMMESLTNLVNSATDLKWS